MPKIYIQKAIKIFRLKIFKDAFLKIYFELSENKEILKSRHIGHFWLIVL